jgi:hypothetical protein
MSNVPVVIGLKATGLTPDDSVVLEVFVASQTRHGDPVGVTEYQVWVDRITEELCKAGGGATRWVAEGTWYSPELGRLQREATTVVRTYVDRGALLMRLPELRQVLVQYGRECEQHTVAFALDGELFGLDPSLPY